MGPRSTSLRPVLRSERFVGSAALPVRRNTTTAFSSSSFRSFVTPGIPMLGEVFNCSDTSTVRELARCHRRREFAFSYSGSCGRVLQRNLAASKRKQIATMNFDARAVRACSGERPFRDPSRPHTKWRASPQ